MPFLVFHLENLFFNNKYIDKQIMHSQPAQQIVENPQGGGFIDQFGRNLTQYGQSWSY